MKNMAKDSTQKNKFIFLGNELLVLFSYTELVCKNNTTAA